MAFLRYSHVLADLSAGVSADQTFGAKRIELLGPNPTPHTAEFKLLVRLDQVGGDTSPTGTLHVGRSRDNVTYEETTGDLRTTEVSPSVSYLETLSVMPYTRLRLAVGGNTPPTVSGKAFLVGTKPFRLVDA
jgi:hypothetical protein